MKDKERIEKLKSEIEEILKPCINCGMCKSICPVFRTLREEYFSPRGKVILMKSHVFADVLFKCNLCRGCEHKCPLNVKVSDAIRKARQVMVLEGYKIEGNEEMVKNLKKHGDPFGKSSKKKKKLYCC